VLLEFAELKT
jgi:hypothetical protein